MNFRDALYQLMADRVKKQRNKLKINQVTLSKKTNVSRSTISNIESGKHSVPLDIIYLIAKELQIDVHILLPTELEVAERMAEPDMESQFVSKLESKNISKSDIELIQRNL